MHACISHDPFSHVHESYVSHAVQQPAAQTTRMRSAGLFATQAAANAKGNPELAAKSKVGQMFGSGSPLRPFVEPLTMYYQVIISPATLSVHHSWFPCHHIVVTLLAYSC